MSNMAALGLGELGEGALGKGCSLAKFEGAAWGSGPRPLRRVSLLVLVSPLALDKVGSVSVESTGEVRLLPPVGLLLLGQGITAG